MASFVMLCGRLWSFVVKRGRSLGFVVVKRGRFCGQMWSFVDAVKVQNKKSALHKSLGFELKMLAVALSSGFLKVSLDRLIAPLLFIPFKLFFSSTLA
jgi:hypothetical protein